jgi:polysaccharide deacetylase family protein (PEP-CTERM system associated)
MPRRVEASTERLLETFERAGVRATFFTLGWVAERHPALVRRIVAGGHELASHGHGHERVDLLGPDAFRADIGRARRVLEDTGGVKVAGYRAPTFSLNARTPWAFALLAAEGHSYSSSVYPVRHDLYGMPEAPRFPYRPERGGVWEIPMTTVRALGRSLPCAGGGWFRLLPYPVFRLGLRRFHRDHAAPCVFYTHPWEYDPAQPRVAGTGRLARFRHYVNLSRTAGRLERLLRDFAWDRMDRVFAEVIAAPDQDSIRRGRRSSPAAQEPATSPSGTAWCAASAGRRQ